MYLQLLSLIIIASMKYKRQIIQNIHGLGLRQLISELLLYSRNNSNVLATIGELLFLKKL
ncbi:hypothetical protein QTP88_005707 [Uroleucon formosanum]